MAGTPLESVVRHIRHFTAPEAAGPLSDRELLHRFADHGDEAAFAALVSRHGRLVWGVCRNVLRHEQDAEDAFQATFLVLARKAGSVRKGEAVGSWLYGVAARVAMRAKRNAAVRRAHERKSVAPRHTPSEVDLREALALVDEEVRRLPDKQRAAFVLCCLEGTAVPEAAKQLGWKEGTVAVTLTRARQRLRERLARRGVTLTAALAAAELARSSAPAALVRSTIRAAGSAAAGQAAGAVSAEAATLCEGVLKTMILDRIKLALVFVLATGLCSAGVGLLAGPGQAGGPQEAQQAERPRPAAQKGGDKTPAAATGAELLGQGLQAADAVQDPGQKARALLLLAEAQTAAGQSKAALETLRKAFAAAGTMPVDDYGQVNSRWQVLAGVAGAQAEAGDVDAARKTVEAIRKPAGNIEALQPALSHGSAYLAIAVAQAKAGKYQTATETVGLIDDKLGWLRGRAQVDIVAVQARASDWKAARATVASLPQDPNKVRALAALAPAQAKAGKQDEARKSLDEALGIVNDFLMDRQGQEQRAETLSVLARAQAEMEDVKAALVTAETIPDVTEKDTFGKVISFPFRERTLVELKARAGDFAGATKIAEKIDGEYHDGYQRGYAFQVIARAQAEAKDVKAALATAGRIEHDITKVAAYTDVARTQARAGDEAGAAKTFAEALKFATEVPEEKWPFGRPQLLRELAAAQAEAGAAAAAREWIATQGPYLRTWALVGLAEGLAKQKRGAK
jgi:RNA polymerase sigma factor (sigma-70 family)